MYIFFLPSHDRVRQGLWPLRSCKMSSSAGGDSASELAPRAHLRIYVRSPERLQRFATWTTFFCNKRRALIGSSHLSILSLPLEALKYIHIQTYIRIFSSGDGIYVTDMRSPIMSRILDNDTKICRSEPQLILFPIGIFNIIVFCMKLFRMTLRW